MKPTYKTAQKQVEEIAEMYNSTSLEAAREVYEQYISVVILNRPFWEQSKLEKLWESKIE